MSEVLLYEHYLNIMSSETKPSVEAKYAIYQVHKLGLLHTEHKSTGNGIERRRYWRMDLGNNRCIT